MKIQRRFTEAGKGPYEGIRFESRSSEIRDPDGQLIFQQDDVVVPSFWSPIATDILAQKYLRKTGVPLEKGGTGGESDARQVFHRLGHTWKEWGQRYGYFDTADDAESFYDELCCMLACQIGAPNSPQWFNTGLYSVYGTKGPAQGHHYVDPDSGKLKKAQSAYERPQPHACFIISVEDDLVNKGGIMDLVRSEARLFKYGSGTGTNYSRIRGKGERLSGGGFSSGLLSFLKIGDRSASAIKSGGTTRRAARMVTLDADHPDIEAYVDWKVEEEQKVVSMVVGSRVIKKHVRSLEKACFGTDTGMPGNFDPSQNPELTVAIRAALMDEIPANYIYKVLQQLLQGFRDLGIKEYDTEWDREAYNTVSGQSSNNSIRLTTAFMDAVTNDGDWQLIGRKNGKRKSKIKARGLWDKIARSAWSCADPGIQYHSTINEWHTCPEDGEIRSSNPCSEYMFLDDTACNLASLNLVKFYDAETATFNIDDFKHAVHLWTIVLEISVLMAQFPTSTIAQNSYDFRTLGLGFANLGTLLMVMGIPYDSEQGRSIAGALSAILTGQAYVSSSMMAEALGPFPRFQANREPMLRVIRNHHRAAYQAEESEYEGLSVFPRGLDPDTTPAALLEAAREVWDEALRRGNEFGFRNAQVSAIAPTGTIGLVMDCDTTGVEPDYALVKYKKLAGGGFFKIINTSIPPALKALGYSKEQIAEINAYCLGHRSLAQAPGVSAEALRARGFSEKTLTLAENALQSSFSLESAFSPKLLGSAVLDQELGIPQSSYSSRDFSLLRTLGFSTEEIETADRYTCGTMTVERAPHLKEEHYSVFDTASITGRNGTRCIRWQAHIEMMAAVQPFVSGAISKTINMPNEATAEDVKGAFFLSWKNMLKSIALYRDRSKLSQPLASLASTSSNGSVKNSLQEQILSLGNGRSDKRVAAGGKKRRCLPNRRKGYTQKAKIGGHSLFLRSGEYPDGSLGELFLDMYKEGAAFRSLLNSFAVAVSLGLQYGVPLEEYVDAFVFSRFEPNGMVYGHDNIKMSTSVLDFIFRDLALSYLKRDDLVQVKPDDLIATNTNGRRNGDKPGPATSEPAAEHTEQTAAEQPAAAAYAAAARIQGYEGDPCPVCGHFTMIRNGTCLKCMTCGTTTGCS